MKLIDINTTQNVTIQYELASLKERIFAFIADFVLLFISLFFILFIAVFFSGGNIDQAVYIIVFPYFFFYTLVIEYLMNGQSPGKKMQKLKIIKLNGKQPEINDFIIRWAFRALDIYFSFGAIASILVGSSNKSQRLGDVLAGTSVVKMMPQHDFKIEDLAKLQSIDDYTATYASVKSLKEEDLLLISKVLDRYNRYPNDGHREALFALSRKLVDHLGIEETSASKEQFLKTLIRDYVILTR